MQPHLILGLLKLFFYFVSICISLSLAGVFLYYLVKMFTGAVAYGDVMFLIK